nr:HupE/UreJ family protein [Oceanococcus sp. HetDA_MAG_MS8]
MQQPLWLDAGDDCEMRTQSRNRSVDGLWLDWILSCQSSWEGRRIQIHGLNARLPDALLEIHGHPKGSQLLKLSHEQPSAVLSLESTAADWPAFFRLGLEHLATGWDHLIFVALLALGFRFGQPITPLLGIITGFTLAHSLSLALVLMADLHLPMAPVEALIALSLALLAADHLRRRHGDSAYNQPPAPATFARLFYLACAFGLVHGLGFADALRDIGLPENHRWAALLMFNLGLETAQVLWLGLLLALAWLLRPYPVTRVVPIGLYLIGALSSSWFMTRLTGI